jgi:PKD repeat protein
VSFGDGTAAAPLASCGAGVTHSFAAAGSYTVTITARDARNGVGTASRVVAVGTPPANQAPAATLVLLPKTVTVGGEVNATTGATDPDHAAGSLACTVDWGDGATSTPASCAGSLVHAYAAAGRYTVTVTARDPLGAVGTAQDTVRVLGAEAPNQAPEIYNLTIADGRGQPYSGPIAIDTKSCAGSTAAQQYTTCVKFGFRDLDGSADAPWSVQVDWGDGSAWTPNALPAQYASLLAPHDYAAPGSYTVRVRVTDRRGASDERTITVVVLPGAPR